MQGFLLQIEISEIIVHEADEPNALVDFLDAQLLAGQHGGDVDPLAMKTEPPAGSDDDVAIVEWIGQVRQACSCAIRRHGRNVSLRRKESFARMAEHGSDTGARKVRLPPSFTKRLA